MTRLASILALVGGLFAAGLTWLGGCSLDTSPLPVVPRTHASGGSASVRSSPVEGDDADGGSAGRGRSRRGAEDDGGGSGAGGDSGASTDADGTVRGDTARPMAGRGAAGSQAAGGAGGSASVAGAGAAMPDRPEGPCDFPACVPQEVRACVAAGACQTDPRDSSVCFDEGERITHEDRTFESVTTALTADGATCFTAIVTAPAADELLAVYRDGSGERFASATRTRTSWTVECSNGTTKVVDLQVCQMLDDVPPGFGDLSRCRQGTCD